MSLAVVPQQLHSIVNNNLCRLTPYVASTDNTTGSTAGTTTDPVLSALLLSGSTSSAKSSSNSVVTLNSKGQWCITSLYIDSYGGATITIPLQLQFQSSEALRSFLTNTTSTISTTTTTATAATATTSSSPTTTTNFNSSSSCCIRPIPINFDEYIQRTISTDTTTATTADTTLSSDDNNNHSSNNNSNILHLAMEGRVTLTFGIGQKAMTSKLEQLHLVGSIYIDGRTNSIICVTEIMVRVSNVVVDNNDDDNDGDTPYNSNRNSSSTATTSNRSSSGTIIIDPIETSNIKLNLEIMATAYSQLQPPPLSLQSFNQNTNGYDSTIQLLSSTTNYYFHHPSYNFNSSSHHNRTSLSLLQSPISTRKLAAAPLVLYVSLVHPLQFTVRTISHPTKMGHTFIALTISHTNVHSYPIQITNIALHPHLRSTHGRMNHHNDINCSSTSAVQWGFVQTNGLTTNNNSNGSLTCTINPRESQSVVLVVNAEQQQQQLSPFLHSKVSSSVNNHCGMRSWFTDSCPLTITTSTENHTATNATSCTNTALGSKEAVYTTNVMYEATTPAMQLSDHSFRVHMTIEQPLLSTTTTEDEDLMNNVVIVGQPFTINVNILNVGPTAYNDDTLSLVVVEEEYGKKKDQTPRDLFFIDTAVSVAIIRNNTDENDDEWMSRPRRQQQSQQQQQQQLRMIPLRIGTIDIPNFQLIDHRTGNALYYCQHKFKVIGVQ